MPLKLLDQSEREVLVDIYQNDFNAKLPDEKQAKVLAYVEGDEIQGFITSEILIRVGMMWVTPEMRDTPQSATMLKEMLRYLAQNIPQGSSVIVIASDEKFQGLCEKSGMRFIEGQVYRSDF